MVLMSSWLPLSTKKSFQDHTFSRGILLSYLSDVELGLWESMMDGGQKGIFLKSEDRRRSCPPWPYEFEPDKLLSMVHIRASMLFVMRSATASSRPQIGIKILSIADD
jgi:hypothetical protein